MGSVKGQPSNRRKFEPIIIRAIRSFKDLGFKPKDIVYILECHNVKLQDVYQIDRYYKEIK